MKTSLFNSQLEQQQWFYNNSNKLGRQSAVTKPSS